MSEEMKQENLLSEEIVTDDVIVLVKKMQQQLNALDKKIDILMSRPKERAFDNKHFSGPSRSFSRPSFRGNDDRRPSPRGEYRPAGRESFGNRESFRPREEREGRFKHQNPRKGSSFEKKPYRSSETYQDGAKPRDAQSSGFSPKKKPSFLKRKNHPS